MQKDVCAVSDSGRLWRLSHVDEKYHLGPRLGFWVQAFPKFTWRCIIFSVLHTCLQMIDLIWDPAPAYFFQVCSHQLIWGFWNQPLKILHDRALCPRANSLLISTNHRDITFGKYCWCTGHFKTVFSIMMWFVENIVINIILHKRSMAEQKTLSNPVLCHMPY